MPLYIRAGLCYSNVATTGARVAHPPRRTETCVVPTPSADLAVLRDLASRVAEIAALPVQQQTVSLWKR